MATPSEDEFRALARSSPWLFRTVHFTRHHAHLATVEAWLSRPGRMLVVDAESGWHVSTGVPYTKAHLTLGGPVCDAVVSPPQEHAPAWRSDGLVAARRGRTTWWAELVAVAGYQPRCSCCPLLWGAESERLDAAAGGQAVPSVPEHPFPESWLIGLDRQTGIVVSLEAIGGEHRDRGFTVDLHEVDAPMDDSLFTP